MCFIFDSAHPRILILGDGAEDHHHCGGRFTCRPAGKHLQRASFERQGQRWKRGGVSSILSYPTKGYRVKGEGKSSSASTTGQGSSIAQASTDQALAGEDWEQVNHLSSDESHQGGPQPPNHPPSAPSHSPDAAAEDPPSTTSDGEVRAVSYSVCRKTGHCFHKNSCGMLRAKRPSELYQWLQICPNCCPRGVIPRDQKFVLSERRPQFLHHLNLNGAVDCLHGYDKTVTPCSQCIGIP